MKFDAFVGPSYTSQSLSVDCEKTINLFLEKVESGQGKNSYVFYKAPGLSPFYDSGTAAVARGALPLNGHIFFVLGDTVYDLLSDGTVNASYSGLPDDGLPVYMAANPTQLVLVASGEAWFLESGTLATVSWLVGIEVTDVGYLDTYFVFLAGEDPLDPNISGDGFYFSEPNDVDSGDTLNFVTAEASANQFVRLIVHQERIWLFGGLISQVFYDNSAADPNNPFAPDLSGVIPYGIAAPASASVFDGTIGWIDRNEDGQGIARRNSGYQAVRVSNHAVEFAWSQYDTIEDAVGWDCIIKGHTFWRLWFPTADRTWQYDAATGDWTEVLSWNEIDGQYEAHRGACAASAFGKVLVGDRTRGIVYEMSTDFLDDDHGTMRVLRRCPIISNENKRIGYPWFELDMGTGVGLSVPYQSWQQTYLLDEAAFDAALAALVPATVTVAQAAEFTAVYDHEMYGWEIDTSTPFPDDTTMNSLGFAYEETPGWDPKVVMRASNDFGNTWSSERQRSFGKIGEFGKRVIWTRNGIARQRVYEIVITDPVPVAISNAYLRRPSGRDT